jgi:hypothetical protein
MFVPNAPHMAAARFSNSHYLFSLVFQVSRDLAGNRLAQVKKPHRPYLLGGRVHQIKETHLQPVSTQLFDARTPAHL